MLALLLILTWLSAVSATTPMIRYAYIWVGGFNNGLDHVAVIDVQPGSPTYSAVYHREYIPSAPTRLLTSTEAHHIYLNYDKTVLMATLVGTGTHDDVYLFDMDDNHFPRFRKSITVGVNHCSDSFTPYDQTAGTYLLSQRCNVTGGGANAYSAIYLINPVTEVTSKWDQVAVGSAAYANFHPHIGFRCNDVVVWSNYFKTQQKSLYQFNIDGTLQQAIALPGLSGDALEIQWIPGVAGYSNCTAGVAITGTGENLLVHFQPGSTVATTLLNFTAIFGETQFSATSSFFTTNKNVTQIRYIATVQSRYVIIMNVDPLTPSAEVIFTFDFCNPPAGWGVPYQNCSLSSHSVLPSTHLIKFDATNNRFFVNNYFTAAMPGTRTSHLFQLSDDRDSFTYDSNYVPDLMGGSPHGLIFGEWVAPKVVPPPLNSVTTLLPSWALFSILVMLAPLLL